MNERTEKSLATIAAGIFAGGVTSKPEEAASIALKCLNELNRLEKEQANRPKSKLI